jgi:small subunit ribosomal protein S7
MRKQKPKPRVITPDPRYNDATVARFVNMLMYDGKKSTAYTLFYDALEFVKDKTTDEPEIEVFHKALKNIMPSVEVRSRRIGGATFQIPMEIRPDRRISIGMKWLINYARARSGKGMANKLSAEILAAAKGEGSAVKKREDTHRMAESNRAFAHFANR